MLYDDFLTINDMTEIEITFESIEMTVGGVYQPYEAPERGPEAQYPGCPEAFEIEQIEVGSQDIFSLLSDEKVEEIEIEVLKHC